MKMRSILAIVASASALTSFGLDNDDFKYTSFGDTPANAPICTNLPEVVSKVSSEINDKQDKFILGKNLKRGSTVFKLTLENPSSFPYQSPIYSTGTNFMQQVELYDVNTKEIPHLDASVNNVGARLDTDENGALIVSFRSDDEYKNIKVIEAVPVDKLVVNVELDEQTACGYSHPNDWRIRWNALSETSDSTSRRSSYDTNVIGKVTELVTVSGTKLSKVKLSTEYMDEINIPEFGSVKYSIVSGDATVEGDVITANNSGVVHARATTDTGEHRDAEVSIYRFDSVSTYSRYLEDTNVNRKRINDWHLDLLQKYRANPTTNRVYYTWNSPTSTKHVGWDGDRFVGEYGKHFFPYQHMTCSSSGGTGFWSTHGIISKHVLLAANHYGDWNHSRAVGMTQYVNWDGKFSGKTAVKLLRYVNLNTWAKENGFEGTDASMGDIGVYVISTLDDENAGIPDECLPYIATTDWMNEQYGYNYQTNAWGSSDSGGLCCVSLNQGATIGLRAAGSLTWGNHSAPFREGSINYATDEEDPVNSSAFRLDIALIARRCGFHSIVMGDSGQPVFMYDPRFTVPNMSYDFGNGPEPLVRPILMWSYCTAMGSTPVGLHIKVLKAFCESVGDSLDYVLGDVNQTTDQTAITEHAVQVTKDMKLGPNAE